MMYVIQTKHSELKKTLNLLTFIRQSLSTNGANVYATAVFDNRSMRLLLKWQQVAKKLRSSPLHALMPPFH